MADPIGVRIGSQSVLVDPSTSPDGWDFWSLVDSGRWEPETIRAISAVVRPGSTFVDVGAWIGPLSLLAASLGAKVSAFELDPVALEFVKQNIALNPALSPLIMLHEVGLAPSSGQATVSADALGTSGTSLVRKRGAVAVVPLIGVQDAVQQGWLDGEVVKIDIEGGEYRLIPRLRPFLRAHRPTLLLSTHVYQFSERIPRSWPRLVRGVILRLLTLRRALLLRHLGFYPTWYVADGDRWRQVGRARAFRELVRPLNRQFLLSTTPLEGINEV